MSDLASVSQFKPYVATVEDMAASALRPGTGHALEPRLGNVLDGQAGAMLRETVPLRVCLKSGHIIPIHRSGG